MKGEKAEIVLDKTPFYAEHPFLHSLGGGDNFNFYYEETADWTTLNPTPCAMTTGHDEMPFAWWHADLADPQFDGGKESW